MKRLEISKDTLVPLGTMAIIATIIYLFVMVQSRVEAHEMQIGKISTDVKEQRVSNDIFEKDVIGRLARIEKGIEDLKH